jgi:thiol-disulfide isomerase/thioredoxin
MELPAYNRVGEKVIPVSRPRETCFPTPRERVDGLQYPWWRQNFALTSADIRQIDLDGLKKIIGHDAKDTRPLLINFWATWCDGCREEFPELVKIDNDYRGKGLNFISISLDDVADINTKVTGFLKEVHAGMPVVVLNVNDPEPAIHFVDPTWQGEMPATFLYDHDGKIVFKYFGKIKPAELRAAIDKQLSPQQ